VLESVSGTLYRVRGSLSGFMDFVNMEMGTVAGYVIWGC
jgi:hypothetical protein